jgi:tetrahydromethanopterin S-methyltransferase subunit G
MKMATAPRKTTPNTQFAESESLAAHVAVCTVRYDNLEKRIEAVEAKVDEVIEEISSYKDSLVRVIITSTATIVISLIGLTVTIALKLG